MGLHPCRPQAVFRQPVRLFIFTTCLALLAAGARCTTEADNLLSPGEANFQILAAYAAKDLECGQVHLLTVPVIADAGRQSVELCVSNILTQSCDIWGSVDNLPAACLAILIGL
jgi:hypothetical protein